MSIGGLICANLSLQHTPIVATMQLKTFVYVLMVAILEELASRSASVGGTDLRGSRQLAYIGHNSNQYCTNKTLGPEAESLLSAAMNILVHFGLESQIIEILNIQVNYELVRSREMMIPRQWLLSVLE
jgi:hypothetical protein